ncbi:MULTISPECIES: hypothetical protein [Streptomyces]|uniref:IS1 family transposase n=1 Tax=Streptomyces katsurahamanus TaxID=2577098 RepID=A0ABW9NQU9_9ACTN|nr:hypothetical protein [Streptomyces katsurahamanus]
MPGHGRIGRPGGTTGQDGRESAMSALPSRPFCRSAHVAQVLGDNGGVSYVCTSCGHSWS